MLKQKRSRQSWWPVYGLALLMIGLLFLAHRVTPSLGWRSFLEGTVLVVGYGLIVSWLEIHPKELLDQPSAEAGSPALESPEMEIFLVSLPSRVQYRFYIGSDPAINCNPPDYPTGRLGSNGHHPAGTIPTLPKEAGNYSTNN